KQAILDTKPSADDGAPLAQLAREHLKAERWDEATAAFKDLADKHPDHPEAKGGVARVAAEKGNAELLANINDAVKESDFEAAWDFCQKAAEISEDSTYYSRITELKKAVSLNYVNELVTKGTASLRSKDFSRAIDYADKALAIDAE